MATLSDARKCSFVIFSCFFLFLNERIEGWKDGGVSRFGEGRRWVRVVRSKPFPALPRMVCCPCACSPEHDDFSLSSAVVMGMELDVYHLLPHA